MDDQTEDPQTDMFSATVASLFDEFAKALEGQKMIIAHVAGYRSALEEAGFSKETAEEMTVDYHSYLWSRNG
jgi:hypothetical protein